MNGLGWVLLKQRRIRIFSTPQNGLWILMDRMLSFAARIGRQFL